MSDDPIEPNDVPLDDPVEVDDELTVDGSTFVIGDDTDEPGTDDPHTDEDADEPDETVETIDRAVLAGGATRSAKPSVDQQHLDEDDVDAGSGLLGWAYLAVLAGIFVIVAIWASSADDVVPVVATESPTTAVEVADGSPVEIDFAVDGNAVVVTGAVPDEGARDTIIDSASARYAEVTDQLTIDSDTTLIGGTANVSGVAFIGDADAQGLLNDSANSLGLEAGSFDIELIELDKTPTAATAAVATNLVTLTGSFPDQASIDQYVLAADGVFGAENVNSSALFVDPDTTLTNSTITVTGLIDSGDLRGQEFETALGQFFGASTIDGSALSFDVSAEALGRLETRLREQLAATPILFESGSAEISAESAAVLEQVAQSIIATPGVNVEIVGHTDSSGDAGLNQVLSDDRARAVLGRLTELGVDPARLTARGAGEAEPIADNETDEGKAANRRIAFEFDGAITAEEAAADAEEADGETEEEEE